MANLSDTIFTFSKLAEMEETKTELTMMFVTPSGLIIGKPITVDPENERLEVGEDPTKFLYSQSTKLTVERIKENEADTSLNETILLKDVTSKLGNVSLKYKFLILNTSQIIAFQTIPSEQSDELLAKLN